MREFTCTYEVHVTTVSMSLEFGIQHLVCPVCAFSLLEPARTDLRRIAWQKFTIIAFHVNIIEYVLVFYTCYCVICTKRYYEGEPCHTNYCPLVSMACMSCFLFSCTCPIFEDVLFKCPSKVTNPEITLFHSDFSYIMN